ncbi:hypothetical protein BD289DRAFT_81845 [Coniella lustricola]|uniref:Uncharacterized protein n=1 Tax=Coniella lustricola TaxID=2025994 RepID=A0A2T3AHB6_9PEZI|nr:hypothetical protein BD289DRAFT_81845 [Coniella lustricola]
MVTRAVAARARAAQALQEDLHKSNEITRAREPSRNVASSSLGKVIAKLCKDSEAPRKSKSGTHNTSKLSYGFRPNEDDESDGRGYEFHGSSPTVANKTEEETSGRSNRGRQAASRSTSSILTIREDRIQAQPQPTGPVTTPRARPLGLSNSRAQPAGGAFCPAGSQGSYTANDLYRRLSRLPPPPPHSMSREEDHGNRRL